MDYYNNMNTQTLIEAVNNATSAPTLLKSVQALAAQQDPAAIPTLIVVLGYNNPGAAVAAVDGLIALGEVVVPELLKQVDGYNYGARAWAVRVFAGIGDPRALDLLITCALEDFSPSVRRAAAKGLGNMRWSQLPPQDIPNAQQKVLDSLFLTLTDGEWIVRYAAVVGLESLGKSNPNLMESIKTKLTQIKAEESETTIQARIDLALVKSL
jgi:phycocyanobilin lyase beta subunit